MAIHSHVVSPFEHLELWTTESEVNWERGSFLFASLPTFVWYSLTYKIFLSMAYLLLLRNCGPL